MTPMKYTIETGIPIERMKRKPGSDEFAAFEKMEIGDSFAVLLPDPDKRAALTMRQHTARQAMRRGANPQFDYATRKAGESRDGLLVRIWRTA